MRRSRHYVIFYHTWVWGFTTGTYYQISCCQDFFVNCSHRLGFVPVVCLIFLNTKISLAMKKLRFVMDFICKLINYLIPHSYFCWSLKKTALSSHYVLIFLLSLSIQKQIQITIWWWYKQACSASSQIEVWILRSGPWTFQKYLFAPKFNFHTGRAWTPKTRMQPQKVESSWLLLLATA